MYVCSNCSLIVMKDSGIIQAKAFRKSRLEFLGLIAKSFWQRSACGIGNFQMRRTLTTIWVQHFRKTSNEKLYINFISSFVLELQLNKFAVYSIISSHRCRLYFRSQASEMNTPGMEDKITIKCGIAILFDFESHGIQYCTFNPVRGEPVGPVWLCRLC